MSRRAPLRSKNLKISWRRNREHFVQKVLGSPSVYYYYHYNNKGDVYGMTAHPADANDAEEIKALAGRVSCASTVFICACDAVAAEQAQDVLDEINQQMGW